MRPYGLDAQAADDDLARTLPLAGEVGSAVILVGYVGVSSAMNRRSFPSRVNSSNVSRNCGGGWTEGGDGRSD